jgi:hypothetical protein
VAPQTRIHFASNLLVHSIDAFDAMLLTYPQKNTEGKEEPRSEQVLVLPYI